MQARLPGSTSARDTRLARIQHHVRDLQNLAGFPISRYLRAVLVPPSLVRAHVSWAQPEGMDPMPKEKTRGLPGTPPSIHPEIVGPTISGSGGEEMVYVNGGTGYTPDGYVFEGVWTGSEWAPGWQDVLANSSGDIGSSQLNSSLYNGDLTLYGYDWTTDTFTPGVPVFVHIIP